LQNLAFSVVDCCVVVGYWHFGHLDQLCEKSTETIGIDTKKLLPELKI
jgi:hypothetical protein